MALLLTLVCYAYFPVNHPQITTSNRKLFLLVTVTIITFILAKITKLFLLSSKTSLMEAVRYPIVVPFAAILLCSLMNSGIATFASGFLTIVLTIALTFDKTGFMILNLIASIIAILSTRTLRRRKEIFVVCAKAWLCIVVALLAIQFYQDSLWSTAILKDIFSAAIFYACHIRASSRIVALV